MKTISYSIVLFLFAYFKAFSQQGFLYQTYPFNPFSINPALAANTNTNFIIGYQIATDDRDSKLYLSSTIKLSKNMGIGFQSMFNHANRIFNRMNYFYDDNTLKMSSISVAYMIPITEQTSLQLGADVGYTKFSSEVIVNIANWTKFEKKTWSGGFGLFVKGKTWGVGLAVPNYKNDSFYSFVSMGGRSAFVHTEKLIRISPTLSLQTKAIYKHFQNRFYNGLDLHTMLLIKDRIGIGVWSQNIFSGNYTNNWLLALDARSQTH